MKRLLLRLLVFGQSGPKTLWLRLSVAFSPISFNIALTRASVLGCCPQVNVGGHTPTLSGVGLSICDGAVYLLQ